MRRSDTYWAGLSTDLLIEQTMMKSVKSQSGLTHGRGFTKPVRNVWVHSMHASATYHLSLKSLTCHTAAETSHTDCEISRSTRDNRDLERIVEWLHQHNPFVVTDGRLRGLASGVTAADADSVTCDIAEAVGDELQKAFDGLSFSEFSVKRKNTVKTLAHLSSCGQPGERNLLDFDSTGLFHRLIVMIERSANLEPYFSYELTATPLSLFKGNIMLKAVKPALAKKLTKCLSQQAQKADLSQNDLLFIVDGGALLHNVRWTKNMTVCEIIKIYVGVLRRRYGQSAIIVFDGYSGGATNDVS